MDEVVSTPQISDVIQLVIAALPNADPSEISESADLYELGLDSSAAVELMLAIESHFNMTFPDALVDESTFRNPRALLEAVRQVVG